MNDLSISGAHLESRPSRALETGLAVVVRASALLLPLAVALGALRGGVATYVGVFVVFGLLSVVELVLGATGISARSRPGDVDPKVVSWAARAQLRVYAVGHMLVVPFALFEVSTGKLATWEVIGVGLSLASMGGTVGGLGGHELFHQRNPVDRLLGVLVYEVFGYGHFAAGHIGGHHVNVGLRHDWGTARRGETIYGFLYRAVVHGFVGGFRLEHARLRRAGRWGWSPANLVVRCTLGTAAMFAGIYALGGLRLVAFHFVVSALTIAFMELFNYISHYALVRPAAGRAAFVEYTWESDNKVVNWFIFNAGRHCHHHEKPAHAFDALRLFHAKAYIPYGIALMAVVSFIPPLYLRKMNRILDARSPGRNAAG